MPKCVQTNPRIPRNDPPVYVVIDDPAPGLYRTTTVKADATRWVSHVPADDWLAAHPELLPGTLFVVWWIDP